ncbi:low temperature requirement protein A [Streptomyces sp. H27-H1]|uniref:low temperature requirement protein A n=1 Tax=Streptomyces sp. H27-H1 TaxID=2996461 RepID=UPI00226DA7A4|nr:low temperature requirement protein A [Streptomyces sp. H27-H1]MCY0925535.1 low temperature requirement protein A [Streptomyces sp. H27-H1]
MFTFSGSKLQGRVDELYARALGRGHTRGPKPRAAWTDAPHLGERLGLFVLIVLGEGIAQVVAEASQAEWNEDPYAVGTGSFLLLVLCGGCPCGAARTGCPFWPRTPCRYG